MHYKDIHLLYPLLIKKIKQTVLRVIFFTINHLYSEFQVNRPINKTFLNSSALDSLFGEMNNLPVNQNKKPTIEHTGFQKEKDSIFSKASRFSIKSHRSVNVCFISLENLFVQSFLGTIGLWKWRHIHNLLLTQPNDKILKWFEEIGSVTDIAKPVNHGYVQISLR